MPKFYNFDDEQLEKNFHLSVNKKEEQALNIF